MSEVPAKLWIDPEYIEDETDCISKLKVLDRDVQYIRSDIVEEMREALKEIFLSSNMNEFGSACGKARAALKRLEEE